MNHCTKGAVRLVFDHLEKRLETYEFLSLFEYLLTNSGSEFGDPEVLESADRKAVWKIPTPCLFCMVLPQGISFEYLTQWDVNLSVNHINSTPRKSLDGKTPYDAALESFGEKPLKALQLKRSSPDEVHLTPKLICYNR